MTSITPNDQYKHDIILESVRLIKNIELGDLLRKVISSYQINKYSILFSAGIDSTVITEISNSLEEVTLFHMKHSADDKNDIKFIEDESNKEDEFDRNFLRNKVFPMLEKRWKNFPKRVNNTSLILKNRNKIYSELFYEKFHELIGNNIELKKIDSLSDSVISDILRYSIKECNIAMPNSKIMKEIIKTFIHSKPGPKSIVKWSRSDKEQDAGKIIYQNGYIVISKR